MVARCLFTGLLLVALAGCKTLPKHAAPPDASSNLVLRAPIERWDEAIPLGNGRSGGLLWGGGRRVVLSLDRGDLWDLRTPEISKYIAKFLQA